MYLYEYYDHLKLKTDKDITIKVRCEQDYLEYLDSLNDLNYNKILVVMSNIVDYVYNNVDKFKSNSHYPLSTNSHKPKQFIKNLINKNDSNTVLSFKTPLNNGDIRIIVSTDPSLVFECFVNHQDIG